MSFKDALKRDWDNSVLKRLLVGKSNDPAEQTSATSTPVASESDARRDEAERSAQATVQAEILDKLTLKDEKKADVSAALSDMVHMAAAYIVRAPEFQLENSSTFGRKQQAFHAALRGAGVEATAADEASKQAVHLIETSLKKDLKTVVPPKKPRSAGPYDYATELLTPPSKNDDPPALQISEEQIQAAVAKGMEAAQSLNFPDQDARARFETALKELAESQAAMLRIPPSSGLQRYEAAEVAQSKSSALGKIVETLNPGHKHANEELLRNINRTMNNALGWER